MYRSKLNFRQHKNAMNFFPRKISLFVSGPKKTVLRPGAQNGYFFHMQSYEISKSALCKISKVLKERTTFFIYLFFSFFYIKTGTVGYYKVLISTWSYENRVGKLPPPNSLLLCCLLTSYLFYFFFFSLVLWLGVCLEVDVDRITILPLSLPPFSFFFLYFFLFRPYPQFSL